MTWGTLCVSFFFFFFFFFFGGHLCQCRFLINKWISLSLTFPHTMFVSLYRTLTSFSSARLVFVMFFVRLLFEFFFIKLISYSSMTKIDSCFYPFLVIFFFCNMRIFLNFFFILEHIFCNIFLPFIGVFLLFCYMFSIFSFTIKILLYLL